MSHIDAYINEMTTDLNQKIFMNDSYVSKKLVEINIMIKQALITPIEYDREYSNVNRNFTIFVMNEMWELHSLLMKFNYVSNLTMPPLRNFNDTNQNLHIRGKLMQDTHKQAHSLLERIQQCDDGLPKRANRVESVYDRCHSSMVVDSLTFYDTNIRYKLIDDCRFIQYIYANFRNFINTNNVQVLTVNDTNTTMNMMM